MSIRTHIGISLDGFIAASDGMPAWDAMPTFAPRKSHGYREFIEQCDAVVIGRAVFDFGHTYWTEQSIWPWAGQRVYVLTSRPLPENAHEGVIASKGGPAELVEQLRDDGLRRDVQVLGGARTIRAFLTIGAIDRLGTVILPVLLGDGVPLFTPGDVSQTSLLLDRQRAFPDGAVELVYRPKA
ncbi:MAG TPA: dihydrofolate reductase family protein [Dehalococcoidia bacterium]|jgi:dihydrofolate reductase